jgi:6-phosphogluconate dehydrogenase
MMRQVARETGWTDLNYGGIALMWRGGCIIRSAFLTDIEAAFARDPQLPSLLFDDFFAEAVKTAESGWRRALGFAIANGIPVPAMSSALAFFDGYRSARSPANLIQAQRDYFGAHTFEFEGAEGTAVHVNWTGRGGAVTSNVYQA